MFRLVSSVGYIMPETKDFGFRAVVLFLLLLLCGSARNVKVLFIQDLKQLLFIFIESFNVPQPAIQAIRKFIIAMIYSKQFPW